MLLINDTALLAQINSILFSLKETKNTCKRYLSNLIKII